MAQNVYQLKISLKNIKPLIWRRILVQPDLPLADLHKIIQTAMGWTNSHLHHFIKGGLYYSGKRDDDDFWDEALNVDYKDLRICDLLKKDNDKIVYEYDFGDGWEHIVLLEKTVPADPAAAYPVCTAGKMACPPEDCGGASGYAELLEIVSQPGHEEYDDYREWLGEDFDPAEFDIDDVNEVLKEDDYGCVELF